MKVIPHQKPKREPKPYTPPRPKRYRVEKYVRHHEGNYWHFVDDFHFARNAKSRARYEEKWDKHYTYRVVDTKG